MKAEELRIGNLMNYGVSEKVLVSQIFKSHFHCDTIKGVHVGSSLQYNFSPIPLTDEWILKCGGVALSDIDSYEKEYTISGFYIRENKRNKGIFYYQETPLPYVHILQNLYFFLRGGSEILTYSHLK